MDKRLISLYYKKTYRKIPSLIAQKVKYNKIAPQEKSASVSNCLDQLQLARVIYKVQHTASNGVPLAAEVKEKDFKIIFLDIGLISARLNLKLTELNIDTVLVNEGALCEQFIGQHLLYLEESYMPPELFYWQRQQKSSNAEVDFIIASGRNVVPIEVKAGKTGTLKSLHVFLKEKHYKFAVRFNTDLPSIGSFSISQTSGEFSLMSLPLYLVERLPELIEKNLE